MFWENQFFMSIKNALPTTGGGARKRGGARMTTRCV